MSRRRFTPNGVTTAAYYSTADGKATMWFDWIVGGIPSSGDCQALASVVAEWDLDGATPGTSYRLFRAGSSRLVGVASWSIDPRSDAMGYLLLPTDAGAGAELVSDPLSDQVAPLMHWICAPAQARRRGRTYMPCLCHNVLQTSRPDVINADARGPLVLCFNGLIQLGLERVSAPMVLLTTQVKNVEVRPCPVSIVASASIGSARVGTQRRRLPRGDRW